VTDGSCCTKDERIAQLERQVASLRAQLNAARELSDSSVESRLRSLLGDRMVLDALPTVVNVLDQHQKIVYLNRTVPGRDVTELYGTDARKYVAEQDRERYTRVFEEAWQSGNPTTVQLRTLSGRHWESNLIPVKDGPEVVFMLVTSADQTERLRSERALRDSEARLRYALSASGMGAWTYQIAEDRVIWDEVTAHLFGILPKDAPTNAQGYFDLIHPGDRERVKAGVDGAIRRRIASDLEHRVLLPNGSVRYLLTRGTVLLDENGTATALRGGVFDITARKALESQLQLAQQMQAVGQLTSGIAHNLNNALSVIIPCAEECQEEVTGELAERVHDITHAAQRAAEMVRQLMLFARPHAHAEKRSFNLNTTVQRIVDMCRKTFERRILLDLRTEQVPPVHGDEGQIEQVLLNICLNARDALANRDEPRISVKISSPRPDGLRVTITDNGTGMDESVQARVFEPFFTTKEVGRGSGLGLASAYAIVTDHGGKIRCKSVLGYGTSFELELPCGASAPPEPISEEIAVDSISGDERILVVDDESAVRRVVASTLKRAGYHVVQCATGHDAVRLFESGDANFDAIVLDRSMPGLAGEQVIRRLRDLGVDTPVIMLTGDASGDWSHDGIALLLNKPVNRRELLTNVRSVIDRSRS